MQWLKRSQLNPQSRGGKAKKSRQLDLFARYRCETCLFDQKKLCDTIKLLVDDLRRDRQCFATCLSVRANIVMLRQYTGHNVSVSSPAHEIDPLDWVISELQGGASFGAWLYYPQKLKIRLSGQWFGMLGYPEKAEKELDICDFEKQYMHPADVRRVRAYFVNYYMSGGRERFDLMMRLRGGDGSWLCILTRGQVVEWRDGMPYLATAVDTLSTEKLWLQQCI